jgi:hypothetical protein
MGNTEQQWRLSDHWLCDQRIERWWSDVVAGYDRHGTPKFGNGD